jgi:hypothetical protein
VFLCAIVFAILSLWVQGLAAEDAAIMGHGSLQGWVVNESGAPQPCARVKVVLRVHLQGQFVPVEETTTDADGHFIFDRLPVGDDILYLPGANVDGVHYPGARVSLSADHPHARLKLVAFDAIAGPSPLVAERHDILVEPEAGVLKVTETIMVNNPTATCYVGSEGSTGAAPDTLRLAIPEDFQHATFYREFFGRQFRVRDGQVVTSIPWPPGQREVKLTYLIANDKRHRIVERVLDLPCSLVRLTVRTGQPQEAICNLSIKSDVEAGCVGFQSQAPLPAGHVIRLELGQLPVNLAAYASWVALAVMLSLIAGVGFWTKQLAR